MKTKKWFSVFFALATLILECLPWGAVLRFANPEGEPWRKTFSYFSPIPFGYANFSPLLTAVLTVFLVIFCLMNLRLAKKKIKKTALVLSVIATVLSLCPLLYGVSYLSPIGIAITLCLGASAFFLWKS